MHDPFLDFQNFLKKAPTSWHAVQEISERLSQAGFAPLNMRDPWQLQPGSKYFVPQGGSCIAFILPDKKIQKLSLLATHTDSPALKLKPKPFFSVENMTLCGVETYGSPLLSSWLNRDLAIAGRIVVKTSSGKREEKLVFLREMRLAIAQLAIHLDRDVNEKGLVLNKQDHLYPIIGLDRQNLSLEMLLKKHFSFEKLLSFDLFLVPVEEPKTLGIDQELLASYRLDNLTSVHAALQALLAQKDKEPSLLKMAYFADHEEIGSQSKAGASSSFLPDVIARLDLSTEEWIRLKEHSLIVSIDMAHGLNPNYAHRYEPQHQPLLGKGVVIKHHAGQRYASDALSVAPIVEACDHLKIPYQHFVCRSDLPCGSTIGPMLAEKLGIATVDIGASQLSMHSIREVIAKKDYEELSLLLNHLLQVR